MTERPHTPVMVSEVMAGLELEANKWYVDATFGAGGHTRAFLEQGANVFAIDQDETTQQYASKIREGLKEHRMEDFILKQGNFRHLDNYVKEAGVSPVAGIFMDLGVSSMQLDEAERGFAFRQDGPLDMRMSAEGTSAADVVNHYSQEDLASIIFKYGEERFSRRIARAIVDARPLHTTGDLVAVIQKAYPGGKRKDHPARRTFQALRIYVNDELAALEDTLKASLNVLAIGARLVVLSYHSLEDRIVKHFIRSEAQLENKTKKPLTATEQECQENPRARSAKLRIAERLA